jgi:hypothetical protein
VRSENINYPGQKSECRNRKGMRSIGILGSDEEMEIIDSSRMGNVNRSGVFKIRKFAQHYLNGLRISAFLIRHGSNRMKVRYIMGIYESWIYPVLYHSEKGPVDKEQDQARQTFCRNH